MEERFEFAFLGVFHGAQVDTASEDLFIASQTTTDMIIFKIDTGADVTTILNVQYQKEEYGPLVPPDMMLTHAGGTPLDCIGKFIGEIGYKQ